MFMPIRWHLPIVAGAGRAVGCGGSGDPAARGYLLACGFPTASGDE